MTTPTTFKFVTLDGIVAPTDQGVPVYVQLTENPDYDDSIVWSTNPSDPAISWSNAQDLDHPAFILATFTVLSSESGDVELIATRQNIAGGTDDVGSITITFVPFELSGGWGGMDPMAVGADWQHPRNINYPNAAASPLCVFSTIVKTGFGVPIEGAEVHWSVKDNSVSTDDLFVKDSAGGSNLVPVYKNYWYTTTSAATTGVATLYVQCNRSCQLSVSASTLGNETTDAQGSTYFVDLYDPSVTPMGDSLQIDLSGGNYDLQGNSTVTLRLPSIQQGYADENNPGQGWIYTDAGLKKQESVPTFFPDLSQVQQGQVIRPPAIFFDINKFETSNEVVLFAQDPAGNVYRSPYTPWSLTGEAKNQPPNLDTVKHDLRLKKPYPYPNPGESNGFITPNNSFTNDKMVLRFDGVIPSDYIGKGYELYYIYYFNNGDGSNEEQYYYPDWTKNAPGISLTNNSVDTKAYLESKYATGFGMVNGKYGQFYCICFLVKTAERLNEPARIYSPWWTTLTWLMST